MRFSLIILAFVVAVPASWASSSTPKEKAAVMPARQRQAIVATAKALFEPQVRSSIRIGRVSSPFAPSTPAK